MSPIWVIARKEFMDVLRDRRTLVFMLLLPIVVMPLAMIAFTRVTKNQLLAKESRRLTVAIDKQGQGLIRAMGQQWWGDNLLHLMTLGGRLMLSLGEMDLDDLEHIVDRVNTYKDAGESTHFGDTALAAGWVAYQNFTDDEKQLLDDAGAVHAVLSRTEWRDIEKLTHGSDVRLPP
ncbi:MAG TPA: hypothetical protein VMV01_12415, partial [Planctomycetota bacterium]|nr:hypothetical protein [Planctomycetota bacterium]